MNNCFETTLTKLGILFSESDRGFYILKLIGNASKQLKVRLLYPESDNERVTESKNGIPIQSTGVFKIRVDSNVIDMDFLIMAIFNLKTQNYDYIIITPCELKTRYFKQFNSKYLRKNLVLVFWLLPDHTLYETRNLSIEAEWFFLSKGKRGCMADSTEWCYTHFLNNWDTLLRNLRSE